MAQQSHPLEPALDVGPEGGGHDDDVAPVLGDELEELCAPGDQVDVSEVVLYLGSCHSNLLGYIWEI